MSRHSEMEYDWDFDPEAAALAAGARTEQELFDQAVYDEVLEAIGEVAEIEGRLRRLAL